MAYGNNKFARIDNLETKICEEQIQCAEVGTEAMMEHNDELSEQMMDRHDQLDLRLKRLAHISAKLSTNLTQQGWI